MSTTLAARRLALCALFLLPGLAMSSWVTRTPAIRDLLGASTAQMGLVIFGLAFGAMVGILCSGPLLARFGAKPLIAFGTLGVAVSVPLVGLGRRTNRAGMGRRLSRSAHRRCPNEDFMTIPLVNEQSEL